MKDLCVLRLYFSHSARATPTHFWHHLSPPTLSQHLLKAARRAGIHQAIVQTVVAGYLPGRSMSHHHPEAVAAHHPLCMELVDTEAKLRKFLDEHHDELRAVQVLFLRAEIPLQRPYHGVLEHAS